MYHNPFRKSVEGKKEGGGDEGIKYKKIGGKKRREMTEKEREKGKKRTGKLMNSFVVLTIVLSVLAVTMLPASAQPIVTRSIDPDTVAPGGVVNVTIVFTTTEDMGFFPALQDVVPEGWVATDMSAVPDATSDFTERTVGFIWFTLGSETPVTTSYTLHVPVTATGGIYELNGTLYKAGTPYADVTGDGTVTVAGPVYGVALTVTPDTPQWVNPSEIETYTLTVTNTGNTEDTFDLTIDDVPADATATLSEGVTPELAPDGTYDIFLNVSSAIENEMGYIVNVTAASQGDPSKSDTVTTKTIVSDEIQIDYTLIKKPDSTGKNWISIPIDTTITNASSLMAEIGPNCDAVNRWNATTQQPEGWISQGGGMGTNFDIVRGEGYEISVTANTTFNQTGVPVSIGPISLIKKPGSTGKNWIGLPYDTILTNASSLMAAIGPNCDAVNRWNATTQQPEGWISQGGGMGTNFDIVRGEGYEISVTANTTWTPV